MSTVRIEVVNGDHWPDIERLFGRAGAGNGCWCQYWLLGPGYRRRDREANRTDLRTQFAAGTAGLLAYNGDIPVAWARLSPRSELRWLLDKYPRYQFSRTDAWSLPCFFVSRHFRGHGVRTTLIEEAVAWGRSHGFPIEAYPIDPSVPGSTRNRFSGVLPIFVAAGFIVEGYLGRDRALVTSA